MKLSVLKRNQQIQKIDLSDEVLEYDYSETNFLIGRSKDCHIVLDDKQISREHSKIVHKNGQWSIERVAFDSLPLKINGEEKDSSDLCVNDSITIGQFTITVDAFKEQKVSQPEIQKIEEPKKIEPVVSALKVEESPADTFNDNQTGEVDLSEPTKEIDSSELTKEINLNENQTGEFEPPSDSFSEEPVFESEIGLDNNAEVVSAPEEGAEGAYSLESIDESESLEDESTRVIQTFASVHLELFGETAPYDKYILEKDRTVIGRDPAKCQIVLNDPEVSSTHAVIVKNNIMITLEDLNSGNGTLLNGDRINKSQLSHNDEFVIGGVTFTIKFRSEFLQEEHARLMPVEEEQSVEVEEVVEVPVEEGETLNAFGEVEASAPEEKSIIKRILKDEQKRKKALYILVAVVMAWFMFDEEPAPTVNNAQNIKKDSKINSKKKEEKIRPDGKKVVLTEEQKRRFSEIFQLGKNHFDNGRYREALDQFDIITVVDPYYNAALPSLVESSKMALKRLEELERKKREEEALIERKAKIQKLLVEARKFTEERNVDLANETFQKIMALDPENYEVGVLKRDLKSWEDEKNRKALEIAQKKAERERMVKALAPSKTLFIQKNWFQAINKLDDFLKITPMDEDLTKEATEMLKTSKEEISAAVNPLLGKAKSLQEGQDLKGAYEVYMQVLKYEPSNTEALNQTNEIKDLLNTKARKIYREAIISESLSLFQDAKEKFQEVQQISPVDSDYYKKATDKLKDYLD